MKCITMHGSPHIRRVTNEKAQMLVNNDIACYCSKEEWKKQVRPIKEVK